MSAGTHAQRVGSSATKNASAAEHGAGHGGRARVWLRPRRRALLISAMTLPLFQSFTCLEAVQEGLLRGLRSQAEKTFVELVEDALTPPGIERDDEK